MRRGRKQGIPLYYQVMRILKDQIVSGKLAPGEQLPSEAELTESYRVSRVVVRQALQMLEDEGLIFKVKGKGTFVSADVDKEKESLPVGISGGSDPDRHGPGREGPGVRAA
ncbi:MAG: GntR family transcriptional regulator [Thermoleophilia bacterium]|nr:GntR family transcriptional regulator [Thermoleophilia bacterium]